MSTSVQPGDGPRTPTSAELDEMSPDQLATLAANLDDVQILHNRRKFPIAGTRAERRAELAVTMWFAISAVSGLAFVAAYIFWPFEYVAPDEPGHFVYSLYTPVIGALFGLSVLTLGVAAIVYVKKFFPDEVSVQQRHDGPSADVDRRTVVAQLAKAGRDTDIARRSMIKRAAGGAAGVLGLGLGAAALGPLIHNPWKGRDQADLWVTTWAPVDGEKVYLRRDTGDPDEISLVRPEDQDAGSMDTVFPFRESERRAFEEGDSDPLHAALRRSDTPVMLIRLRPGTEVIKRQGQEDFNFGDYFAFSKICSHLGCPTSLYETQTQRILCPCHQSQFLATEYAKPIFGPAARALPQLPITVDEDGYFVARSDFIEPVGPGFWEWPGYKNRGQS